MTDAGQDARDIEARRAAPGRQVICHLRNYAIRDIVPAQMSDTEPGGASNDDPE
jgi:hypothetical protein